MARGDHLYVLCFGYSHHGIDCGDGHVIHFNSGPFQKVVGQLTDQPARIERVTIQEFSQGRELMQRFYDVCDDPEMTVQRAHSRIGDSGYQLFENNCEHFAVWCKTGWPHSTQVDAIRHAANGATRQLPTALTLARLARRLPSRARFLAYGTALALTAGAFAVEYVKVRLDHQRRGES